MESIKGIVIHGNKRGREIGYPTANIDVDAGTLPQTGIYAVWITVKGTKHMGAASYGYNPTFKLEKARLEVHILNFDADIYDEEVAVDFVKFIRPELKFDGVDDLVAQMDKDCTEVRRILEEAAA